MSRYSTQLRTFIETQSYDQPTLSHKDKIEIGRPKLFDFDYPIFDPAYKKVFETHFIRKFYMREVGFETFGLFKFQLETWLIINMPYFNKMFESELIQFDPLENSKSSNHWTKTNDTSSTSKSNSSNTSSSDSTSTNDDFNRNIDSDTPDSRLQLTARDGEGVIEYASQISENTNNGKTTNNGNTSESSNISADGTINETEDYIQSRSGKIGVQSYSKMLNEYRDSFLRIENKIFEEMQQLFMLVY